MPLSSGTTGTVLSTDPIRETSWNVWGQSNAAGMKRIKHIQVVKAENVHFLCGRRHITYIQSHATRERHQYHDRPPQRPAYMQTSWMWLHLRCQAPWRPTFVVNGSFSAGNFGGDGLVSVEMPCGTMDAEAKGICSARMYRSSWNSVESAESFIEV